jgi:hypothetical protein
MPPLQIEHKGRRGEVMGPTVLKRDAAHAISAFPRPVADLDLRRFGTNKPTHPLVRKEIVA